MAARVKYLSQEWRDDLEKRLKSELPPEKMNFLTSSMLNMYRIVRTGRTASCISSTRRGASPSCPWGSRER